jgi:hypothetical protein
MRRPTSRRANATSAVSTVSMNPGATALIVAPWPRIRSASASTMPIMPALLAA